MGFGGQERTIKEEQSLIDVCDISKDKITVGQIQGSFTSTWVKFLTQAPVVIFPLIMMPSQTSQISLCAANKQSFSAVSKGNMVIDVPNSSSILQLKLTEVLYLPEAGYILVFVGCLNKTGFTTTFANGKCVIHDPGGTWVIEIPCNSASLYKLIKKTDNEGHINGVVKSLILDQILVILHLLQLLSFFMIG